MTDVSANSPPRHPSRMGEARWPMALAVLTAATLRLTLPAALRFHDVSWLLGVFVVGILAVLIETWGWIALIWGGVVVLPRGSRSSRRGSGPAG